MNILILSTHLNTGGISQYILLLAKGLKKENHNIYVVTAGGNLVDSLTAAGAVHVTCNIKTKSELNPKIYFALKNLCHLIKEKNIDVIHAQTRVTQVMASLLSRFTGKPYVSTCHGFFKNRLSRRIFPCWGQGVIAISEPVKNHLIKDFGVKEKKVFLVHSGVDVKEFFSVDKNLRTEKRREFGVEDKFVIGIIARLSDVKGHDILIAAMKKVVEKEPRAVLFIIGEGPQENMLKAMVKNLLLEKHVRFIPLVNKTASVLPVFDIFVLPSLQEGLGLAIMEAQAAGLPVIASRVGGIPSLVTHGKTGYLVEPKDIHGLADVIINLMNDKAKQESMGLTAKTFIESEFSMEKMVNGTLAVYTKVIHDYAK